MVLILDCEFWMVDCAEGAVAALLRASRLRRGKVAGSESGEKAETGNWKPERQ